MVDFLEDYATLLQRLQTGKLRLNAQNKNPVFSSFMFSIGGKEIPVAVIMSVGINRIRIFRGYGEKIAAIKPENKERLFSALLHEKKFEIWRLDQDTGEALDVVVFEGKIKVGHDAEMWGFLMETIVVDVTAIIAGD